MDARCDDDAIVLREGRDPPYSHAGRPPQVGKNCIIHVNPVEGASSDTSWPSAASPYFAPAFCPGRAEAPRRDRSNAIGIHPCNGVAPSFKLDKGGSAIFGCEASVHRT